MKNKIKELRLKRQKLRLTSLGFNHDLKTRLLLYKSKKHFDKTGEFIWILN